MQRMNLTHSMGIAVWENGLWRDLCYKASTYCARIAVDVTTWDRKDGVGIAALCPDFFQVCPQGVAGACRITSLQSASPGLQMHLLNVSLFQTLACGEFWMLASLSGVSSSRGAVWTPGAICPDAKGTGFSGER